MYYKGFDVIGTSICSVYRQKIYVCSFNGVRFVVIVGIYDRVMCKLNHLCGFFGGCFVIDFHELCDLKHLLFAFQELGNWKS